MLVALGDAGERRRAERGMATEPFRCPMCEGRVILKRGRKVAAHFAHLPGGSCPSAEAKGWRHLLAKQVLIEEFHQRGWHARLEVAHPDAGRRIDVGARVPDGAGAFRYVAIEIQDSPIQFEAMKQRVDIDRTKKYVATAWLFTSRRTAALVVAARPRIEVRIPREMLWVANWYERGVPVIDRSSARSVSPRSPR
jgi:competence CoiA-like predicted nuclease